ncbi:histidine phosphatase family protein [Chloroflexota bacterium]
MQFTHGEVMISENSLPTTTTPLLLAEEVQNTATIMLIRHGETAWNVEEIFRGRADVELNETGTEQAQMLAAYLQNAPITAVYSSPLKRALKTAEMIANCHGVGVSIAPELVDFDYGKWQGLSHSAVKERYKELYHEWLRNPHLVKMPDGESLDEVKERAATLVEQAIAKYEGTIALVSHRVVNKVLICGLLGLDNSHFWNTKLDTCGITSFTYEDGRFVLVRHNDTSFLRAVARAVLKDF